MTYKMNNLSLMSFLIYSCWLMIFFLESRKSLVFGDTREKHDMGHTKCMF